MRSNVAVLGLLLAAACAVAGGQSAQAAGAAPAGSAPAGDVAAVPLAAPADEAAARRAVEAWLGAQNRGDFAAYAALYAGRFEGIKRVGARTWRFDRAGWLADRERMFARPMKVAATGITIGGSGAVATVELVQSFSLGTFKDEGNKRMVLVRGADGYRIAREEMLRSVVGSATAAAADTADTVHLVLSIDKKPYVVIQPGQAAWASGAPRGPFAEGRLQLALRDARNAPAAAAWANRPLAVYDAAGRACPATVGALWLVAGGTPHWAATEAWEGRSADGSNGRVWPQAERAREVWAMSAPTLVGELIVRGDCKPAVALLPTAKATVFSATTTDAALRKAAIAAFAALPEHAALQAAFAATAPAGGPWAPSPVVASFAAADRRVVVVSASKGEGCGEFLGQLSAVFELRAGKLRLLSNPADGFMRVDLIADSDGDGRIELIGAVQDSRMLSGHFVPAGKGFTPARQMAFPFNDCGC